MELQRERVHKVQGKVEEWGGTEEALRDRMMWEAITLPKQSYVSGCPPQVPLHEHMQHGKQTRRN